MSIDTHEYDRLAERLEKLEKQLRWIKRTAYVAAAVLAVLVLSYRLAHYRQVTAQEFVLTDSGGRVRAKLASFPEGPGLEVYAASGEPRVQLIGDGEDASLNLYIPATAGQGAASVNLFRDTTLMSSFRAEPSTVLLEMRSPHGHGIAALALRHGTTSLTLSGAGEDAPKVSLQTDATHACAALDGTVQPSASGSLCLYSPGLPTLELADLRGNRAVLGISQTAGLTAGKPQESSAASLNLEHKSGKSVHLAPK